MRKRAFFNEHGTGVEEICDLFECTGLMANVEALLGGYQIAREESGAVRVPIKHGRAHSSPQAVTGAM